MAALAPPGDTPNRTSPLPTQLQTTIDRIHSHPTQASLIVTGGAASSLHWLLATPGASCTVLDAHVPYSRRAVVDLLSRGHAANPPRAPSSYASPDVALGLARAAYRRAVALAEVGARVVGVGAACALVTSRERRGRDCCVVAVEESGGVSRLYEMEMEKGARTRWEEDELAGRLVVAALGSQCGMEFEDLRGALIGSEGLSIVHTSSALEDPLDDLLRGDIECVELGSDRTPVIVDAPRRGVVIVSGSFNPVHDGHRQMLKAACTQTGLSGVFELSSQNADKGLLAKEEIARRARQFDPTTPLVVSRVPLFAQKAQLFQGCCFAVGYDTAVRLVNAKYYGGEHAAMVEALRKVRDSGCRFLVAGRVSPEGQFCTLRDICVPDEVADLFEEIREEDFRMDISSTEIRECRRKG